MFMKTTRPYYLNMAPFQNKKARNPPQLLQKSWRVHNFLPWNMAIFFWKISKNISWSCSLGLFLKKNSKMVNFCPKKITNWTPAPPPPLESPKAKNIFLEFCVGGVEKNWCHLKTPLSYFLSFQKLKFQLPPTYLPT